MFGGEGNDFFFGDQGADSHDGGTDFDTMSYLASGEGVVLNMQTGGTVGDAEGDSYVSIERMFGSNHDDSITGSNGDDTLFGNGGSDYIDGGQGNDRIFGGAGDDSFGFNVTDGGTDLIYNYRAGTLGNEQITLLGNSADFDSFAEVMSAASQVGNNVVIDFGDGNSLTLVDLDISRLDADDFAFETPEPPMAEVFEEVHENFVDMLL